MPTKTFVLTILAAALALSCPSYGSAQKSDTVAASGYVSGSYGYSHFIEGPDPWQLASVSAGHRTSRGSISASANFARRFGNQGLQAEVDAYPRLSPNVYAYLNVGYSKTSVFPRWRSGAELFASLPNAWEASAGYRQLRFGGDPVTLYTGTVGKYSGNWWTSVRPYVRKKDNGLSSSLGLTVRRYTADGDNYLGATLSGGTSPTDRIDPTQLAQARSWSTGVHGSWTVRPRTTATWSLGYDYEIFLNRNERRRLDTSIGLRFDH